MTKEKGKWLKDVAVVAGLGVALVGASVEGLALLALIGSVIVILVVVCDLFASPQKEVEEAGESKVKETAETEVVKSFYFYFTDDETNKTYTFMVNFDLETKLPKLHVWDKLGEQWLPLPCVIDLTVIKG